MNDMNDMYSLLNSEYEGLTGKIIGQLTVIKEVRRQNGYHNESSFFEILRVFCINWSWSMSNLVI